MKQFLITSLSILTLVCSAIAQEAPKEQELDPARLASSRELVTLLEVDKALDATFDNMGGMMDGIIDQQGLKGKRAKKAKAAANKAMETSIEATKEIDWEGTIAEIYAEVFTVEDIEQLIAFYKTPAGQKFIEKQPELQVAMMKKMQVIMGDVMKKVKAKMEEALEKEDEKAAE